MSRLSRRDLLKAGMGAAALGFPNMVRAQGKEVAKFCGCVIFSD